MAGVRGVVEGVSQQGGGGGGVGSLCVMYCNNSDDDDDDDDDPSSLVCCCCFCFPPPPPTPSLAVVARVFVIRINLDGAVVVAQQGVPVVPVRTPLRRLPC